MTLLVECSQTARLKALLVESYVSAVLANPVGCYGDKEEQNGHEDDTHVCPPPRWS